MKRPFLLLSTLILLWSCHQDSDTVVREEEKPTPPTIRITTRLVSLIDTHQVVDAGAVQTFASQIAPSGTFPYHAFKAQGINRDFETITHTNSQQISFHAAPALVENDVNYFHWHYPVLTSHPYHSDQAVTFQINNTVRINLPPHSLLNADETGYQGPFTLHTSTLHASAPEDGTIPSFQGIESSGLIRHLMIDQCIYIYALTPSGNVLKFNTGAELLIENSQGHPTWKFSSQNGIWEILSHDASTIPLTSSGYYSIANAVNSVRVTGNLQINGKTIPHQPVAIGYEGQQQIIYTTNTGHWVAYVPVNTICEVSTSTSCGQTFTSSFETSESENQIINLAFEHQDITTASIQGIVRDCEAGLLTGQYLEIKEPAPQFVYTESPEFSFNLPVCTGTSIELKAINTTNAETSPSVAWKSADTIEVHSVFVCDKAHHEYLSLTVAGENKMYWDLKSATIGQGRILIEQGPAENELLLDIYMTGMMEGMYDNTKLNIVFEDPNLGSRGYSLYCPTTTTGCGFTTFTVTHFPTEQGEWIRGYFEGEFWIKTFTPLTAGYQPVKGEFQVYREF